MPVYRFHIDVPITGATVVERLKLCTRDMPTFAETLKESFPWSARDDKTFKGTIDASSFRIMRRIRYRNSFQPVIRGTITELRPGSRIDVRMTLHPFVAVFAIVWLALACNFLFMGFSSAVTSFVWIPTLMVVAFVAMLVGGFAFEAWKGRKLLEQALLGAR
jgi:hypothetical protein